MVYSQQKYFWNKWKLINPLLVVLLWVTASHCGTACLLSEVSKLKNIINQKAIKSRCFDFYTKLSQEQFLLSACSVLSLPLFHIPNMFSYFWLVICKLGFGDLEALAYIMQPFDFKLIFSVVGHLEVSESQTRTRSEQLASYCANRICH